MSEQLTKKQIAARAYHQANKERINAQKKAKYHAKARKPRAVKAVKSAPAPQRLPAKKPLNVKGEQEVVIQSIKVNADDQARLAKRRRKEDILLARELGISVEDFA